jgi:anti-sigma factor (TIGR02949 family)
MSCGDPHDLDCASALEHLYEYLDGEDGPIEGHRIAQHLHECSPCLAEYDVERIIKSLVARSCGQHAPSQLRARVVSELASMRIQLRPPSR